MCLDNFAWGGGGRSEKRGNLYFWNFFYFQNSFKRTYFQKKTKKAFKNDMIFKIIKKINK